MGITRCCDQSGQAERPVHSLCTARANNGDMAQPTQIVWFKRDLRVFDHKPLAAALARGPTLALCIIEPELWRQSDRSGRHWRFWRDAVADLDEALRQLGGRLTVRIGETLPVLTRLQREHGPLALWAHEETGTLWTDRRDIAVRRWCRDQGIALTEFRQFGVFRPLKHRNNWASRWRQQMRQPLATLPATHSWTVADSTPGWEHWQPSISGERVGGPESTMQLSGRAQAESDLTSFLTERGRSYSTELSSPVSAESACSRISAHLSVGTISIREAAKATWLQQDKLQRKESWPRSLKAFEGRLHWHCHFVQKFESEPRIEFENLSRAMDGMRETEFDDDLYQAWAAGQTGYPFVDACMRYLRDTGWINFRMRAMLMSFAAYQLWLHWRQPALHLARCFLDYEPGIHYSQVQMQSGTTGINATRIYNPLKQSRDQDPDGDFIRRWVPELAGVTGDWIHEPWRMTKTQLDQAGVHIGRDYPRPVVDHQKTAAAARKRLAGFRSSSAARQESFRIMEKHGSRRRRSQRTSLGG